MFHKANYCCECGEKIERLSESLLSNSKFCEVCKPNYRFETYALKGLIGLGALGLVFGFGSFIKKPVDPSVAIRKGEIASIATVPKQLVANNAKAEKANANFVAANSSAKNETKLPVASFEKQATLKTAVAPLIEVSEPAYFCGAKTKKGSPCSRKVKGAVRCWQHDGQPAMLPPNKLIASQ